MMLPIDTPKLLLVSPFSSVALVMSNATISVITQMSKARFSIIHHPTPNLAGTAKTISESPFVLIPLA